MFLLIFVSGATNQTETENAEKIPPFNVTVKMVTVNVVKT